MMAASKSLSFTVLFGTGFVYSMFMKTQTKIKNLLATDNNNKKHWKVIEGLTVLPLHSIDFTKVEKIIICTSNPLVIFLQLIKLGVLKKLKEIGWNNIFDFYLKYNKLSFKFKYVEKNFKVIMYKDQIAKKNSTIFLKKCGMINVNIRNIPVILAYLDDDKLDFFFQLSRNYNSSSSNKNIFFDIGANIGTSSISCITRKYADLVFSFEPDSSNYSQLVENINLNGFGKKLFH